MTSKITNTTIKDYYTGEKSLPPRRRGSIELPLIDRPFNAPSVELLSDRASVQLPGICGIVTAPIQFVQTVIDLVKSHKAKEKVESKELTLKLAGTTISFSYSIANVSGRIIQVATYFNLFAWELSYLMPLVPILGTILCLAEALLESAGIVRAFYSRGKLHQINEKTPETLAIYYAQENINRLHRDYFTVSPKEQKEISQKIEADHPNLSIEEKSKLFEAEVALKLKKSYRKLARRVRPFMAKEILEKSQGLKTGLQSKDPEVRRKALREARDLFDKTDIQFQKALLIHSVGLLAIGAAIISFGLTTAIAPLGGIVFVAILVTALGTARVVLHTCLLDEKGWSFNASKIPQAFIPEVVINKIGKYYRKWIKGIVENPKEIEMKPLTTRLLDPLPAA